MHRTVVIIPACNEEARITSTVAACLKAPQVSEVVVVDDGSRDKTADVARQAGARVIRLEANRGKGGALNAAWRKVKADIYVFVDADLGETAREISRLITPVAAGEADMAIALFARARTKGGFGLVKGVARWGIRTFGGLDTKSPLSGQRAIRREVLETTGSLEKGWGLEVGLTIDALRSGFRVIEIPVEMTHAETGRTLAGFKHRFRQFLHVSLALGRRVVSKRRV